MKKILLIGLLFSMVFTAVAEARGRIGSHRYGGYTSHGKGSHYYGGH